MKNLKFLSAMFVLFAAFNFTSCTDAEPIDESIVVPIPTNPGPNPTGDCANPVGFQASDFIDGTNVNLSWIAGDEEIEWEVDYGPIGFEVGDGTSVSSNETNLTITGLNAASGYHFYVRAVCPDGGFSGWVGPVTVGTGGGGGGSATCGIPATVTAVRREANLTQVDVAWTSAGSASQWEIQYGAVGFMPGTGTSVMSTVTSKTINNLSQNQDFHIWVRAVCGDEGFSNWSGPVKVEAINALTANVNAVAFVPLEVNAGISTVEELEYIDVSATDEDGNSIKVLVRRNLPVGTYHDMPDVILSYTLDGEEFVANGPTAPTVVITQKTPHSLVGTFTFTVVNDAGVTLYTITNGTFAVTF